VALTNLAPAELPEKAYNYAVYEVVQRYLMAVLKQLANVFLMVLLYGMIE